MSQSAGSNRGQAAGNNRFVKFSHGAAKRIADVVRTVEAGDRNQPPLTFDHPMPGGSKLFRVGTFTGSWGIGQACVVTYKYITTTPNTVSAQNLFLPLPDYGTAVRDCAIAKDGSSWFLLQVKMDSKDFVESASLTTSAVTFTRYRGLSLGTAATVQLSVVTCATSTAG